MHKINTRLKYHEFNVKKIGKWSYFLKIQLIPKPELGHVFSTGLPLYTMHLLELLA